MSFGDPMGPLRPGVGPDILPGVLNERPDVRFEPIDPIRPTRGDRAADFLKFCGLFGAATLGLTVMVSIPVFISEVGMIDAVSLEGELLTAEQFVDRLQNLVIGSFIIALSLASFVASAALASPQPGVRVMGKDPYEDERLKPADPVQSARTKVHHV